MRNVRGILKVIFAILFIALFYTQIVKGNYYFQLSESNRLKIVPIHAPRGKIYDRNNVLLADNKTCFSCSVTLSEIKDKKGTIRMLSSVLKTPEAIMEKEFKKAKNNPFFPHPVVNDITKEEVIKIAEKSFCFPGITIEAEPKREYPYSAACGHITGYIGLINQSEFLKLSKYGYLYTDYIGRFGIEKQYNDYLKGESGYLEVEVDNMGRRKRILETQDPMPGKNIVTTIDIRLQEYIYKITKDKKGAFIVMIPDTGEILALVSQPSFDPNIFIEKNNIKIESLLCDKTKPMLNRAIMSSYPPGSVFKIVTGTSAMETGKINKNTTFTCNGKYHFGNTVFKCWKDDGHGAQNIIYGLKNSCNVFFYNVGNLSGVDNIAKYANIFGYGQLTMIDLPFETIGLVPNKLWKLFSLRQKWYLGETISYAIGQGYLLTTPIQVLQMIATVANRGTLVRPFVVKSIYGVEIAGHQEKTLKISPATFDVIIEGLKEVVESGTGIYANVKGLPIAGKTGTAQASKGEDHAWFCGFSPIESPKIALVAFVEHGGKGGVHAASIAKKIFEKLQELGYL